MSDYRTEIFQWAAGVLGRRRPAKQLTDWSGVGIAISEMRYRHFPIEQQSRIVSRAMDDVINRNADPGEAIWLRFREDVMRTEAAGRDAEAGR